MLVTLPDGIEIRASGLRRRKVEHPALDYGLYCDSAWKPDWPAKILEWPDGGIPNDPVEAVEAIRDAFSRAKAGQHVEIGCIGGHGRTGTVLACMAVLAGVAAKEAVEWVRTHYDSRAVETRRQGRWVLWFADFQEIAGGVSSPGVTSAPA